MRRQGHGHGDKRQPIRKYCDNIQQTAVKARPVPSVPRFCLT